MSLYQEKNISFAFGTLLITLHAFNRVLVTSSQNTVTIGKTDINVFIRLKKLPNENWSIESNTSEKRSTKAFDKLPPTINEKLEKAVLDAANKFLRQEEIKEILKTEGMKDNQLKVESARSALLVEHLKKIKELEENLTRAKLEIEMFETRFLLTHS